MSGALVINEQARIAIAKAIAKARENPTPFLQELVDASPTDTVTLAQRSKPGAMKLRQQYPVQQMMLGTYHVAISFEHQPAGLMRHLSVAAQIRGKVPGPEVMEMLVVEFGFSGWPLQRPHRMWMEEFEHKRHAMNVVELEPNA